jgi:hypothetical protein
MKRKSKVTRAFEALGKIDLKHEKGTISQGEHNKQSKEVLKRLVKK